MDSLLKGLSDLDNYVTRVPQPHSDHMGPPLIISILWGILETSVQLLCSAPTREIKQSTVLTVISGLSV